MSKIILYVVLVEALGFASGVAKKGETITADQIGEENVERLKAEGVITEYIEPATVDVQSTPEAPHPSEPITENGEESGDQGQGEPETLQARLAVGLPPVDGYVLTEAEIAWVNDVKAGVTPVPFDDDKISDLTVKEIGARVEGLGGDKLPGNSSKANAKEKLQEAIEAYFAAWEVGGGE